MAFGKISMGNFRKWLIAGVAIAGVVGLAAPASAGGYYGHIGYHSGYYNGGYYGGPYRAHHRVRGHHYGRHYRRGHHHHHHYRRGGGGKAAAIALGVIGGAIILNEIAEDREERRYEDRRDYERYSTRRAPAYDREAYDRGYEEGLERARREASGADANRGAGNAPRDLRNGDIPDDSLEYELEGAGRDGGYSDRYDRGPQPIRFSTMDAYRSCTAHARRALSERGFILAAPPSPETAEDVGAAWKMTATVSAQNRGGESWSRAMYCEADASRVYLLELI